MKHIDFNNIGADFILDVKKDCKVCHGTGMNISNGKDCFKCAKPINKKAS